MEIYYDNRTDEDDLEYREIVKKALEETVIEENCIKNIEISVSFVTDEEIRELNNIHRDKDKATDVLSFPMIEYKVGQFFKDLTENDLQYSKNHETGMIQIGDIVISLETIRRQACDLNNTFENELALMVIHSMLHLMGYDHMVSEEEKVMFEKQQKICERINV